MVEKEKRIVRVKEAESVPHELKLLDLLLDDDCDVFYTP